MRSERLTIEGLSKSFGDVAAVAGVDLDVPPGRMLVLLGPSGCGKTTLLRLIAGFLAPSAGRIRIGEADVATLPPNRRDIGIVFQNYALFPHLTVAKNVAFGLRVRQESADRQESRVAEVLSLLRLEGFEGRYPSQLSGGQQQRVALARALAIDPRLLLLDEPLSALDKNLRQNVQQELRRLQKRVGVTTIVVTHDQDEAFALADEIAVMDGGKIVQRGAPQAIYDRPATRFVAGFLGTGNTIPARAIGAEPGRWRLRAPDGAEISVACSGTPPADGAVDLFFRPERVGLRDGTAGGLDLPARVMEVRAMGARVELALEVAEGRQIVAFLPAGAPDTDVSVGQTVRARVAVDALTCLTE